MDHADMVKVVEAYVSAYNSKDFEGVLSLYADDATMEDPVGAPPATGKDEIRALYKMGFDMGISVELDGRVRTAAEFAVFPLCATSEQGKLYIVDLFEFNEEGRVVRMRAFWSPENLDGEMDLRTDLA
jgi:steroid delta-isomerase